jgi:adenylate cyclase
MKRKCALTVVLFLATLGSHTLHARLKGKPLLDSMLKELTSDSYQNREDTIKVSLLGDIVFQYYLLNMPDTMQKYANKQLALARSLDWQTGIARSIDFLGMVCESKNEPGKALLYYDTSLQIFEQINKRKAADGAFYSGALCYNINDNARAIQYFFKALKICESAGVCDVQANCYTGIAVVYGAGRDFASAVEYHTRAMKTADNCPDIDSTQRLQIYANLAVAYQYKGDCASSLPYCFLALKLAGELGKPDVTANMYGNICLAYTQLRDYEKAVDYGHRALSFSDSVHDMQHVAWSLYELGHAYLGSITDTSDIGEKQRVSMGGMTKENMAARLSTVLNYLERGLDSANGLVNESALKVKIYEDLAKAYRLKGDWKRCLLVHEKYMTLKDSIFTKEAGMQLRTQQMKYDFSKKEAAAKARQEKRDMKQKNIRNSTMAGMLGLLVFAIVVMRQRNRVKREKAIVEMEKGRSDALLLNILPEEVASELKTTGTTAAKHYDNVTVLFTDFVNFTQAGEQMSPQDLIDELHNCFKMFDEITAKYNIEKIKTIGDAYLAVAGLPTADNHHAGNVVNAAKEILAFMEGRLAKMGSEKTFQIRIGIHSGSVVAGIVGVKKFAYDIWGDTVNTAARMEQNSEAGKINISQTTYELVKDKFTCEYRGEVEVKGKGGMKMYFVG